MILMLLCSTAALPVHVDMNPPVAPAIEQNLRAELTRANAIVDQLMQMSHTAEQDARTQLTRANAIIEQLISQAPEQNLRTELMRANEVISQLVQTSQAPEQNLREELTRANAIIDQLMQMSQAAEQDFRTQLTRANTIIDQLVETPDVLHLLRRLRQNLSTDDRQVLEYQLENTFEAALFQGGVPPAMVPALAQLLAHNTVRGIRMVSAMHGDSIVVYFLCRTVKSLYEVGQMIISGFMHAVFAVAIESVASTTVDVYVRADEFNLKLLCLSSPQHKGLSLDIDSYC